MFMIIFRISFYLFAASFRIFFCGKIMEFFNKEKYWNFHNFPEKHELRCMIQCQEQSSIALLVKPIWYPINFHLSMYEKRLQKTTLKAFYAVLQVKKESQNNVW